MSSALFCPKCGKPVIKGGHGRGKQRFHCKPGCGWHGTDPVVPEKAPVRNYGKHFVITSAQNATPVFSRFLKSLEHYCAVEGAELIIVPYRYTNPTSIWSQRAQSQDWWDEAVTKYLVEDRVELSKHLVLLGDIKTQPTSAFPLSGCETMTGERSAIIGHPKIELTTIATRQHVLAKILSTTGTVTKANYIPSAAGKKAEHHHVFGALVVRINDAGEFFLFEVNATRDGSFQHLNKVYGPTEITDGTVEALVMGDTHEEFVDPGVVAATFTDDDSINNTLKPKRLVWHDVHDFYSRNHHHKHNPFINYVKHKAGKTNVEAGLFKTFDFINRHVHPDQINVIVPSNHHDALARWVMESDPRDDPENAIFWAKTFTAMCEQSEMGHSGAKIIDPFAYWGKKKLTGHNIFLSRNQSCQIKGIEIGLHGDKGANGARGTRAGLSRIGAKSVIGHSHAAGIKGGCYQVGTSSRLGLEYNAGPSSWVHAHCAIYGTGKRSLIFIVNGKWRP